MEVALVRVELFNFSLAFFLPHANVHVHCFTNFYIIKDKYLKVKEINETIPQLRVDTQERYILSVMILCFFFFFVCRVSGVIIVR